MPLPGNRMAPLSIRNVSIDCLPIMNLITRYTVHGRGAKTLHLGNCRLTTASGILVLNSFLSCDARNVKYLFFKSAQKIDQKLIRDQINLVQSLTAERHVSNPHMPLGKINYNLHGWTVHLILTTRRT